MSSTGAFFFQSGGGGGGGGFDPLSATQYQQEVGQTQAIAVGLSNSLLDSATYLTSELYYQVYRSNSAEETVGEVGALRAFFDPTGAGSWGLSRYVYDTFGLTTSVGMSFQIDSSGLVLFTASDWPGAGYTGYIQFQFLSAIRGPA